MSKFICYIILSIVLFGACKPNVKRYTNAEKKEFKNNLVKANKGLVVQDQDNISDYVANKEWNMTETNTGLWYEIIRHGDGEKAEFGKVIHLRYQVKLLDGTVCYSSDSLGIKSFKIGQGGVEPGLEEGVLLLKEGDAARFILPPYLAFGLLGDENKIPPRSTIVYNVEMLKLTDY